MEISVALSGALRHLIWCPTSLPFPFRLLVQFFTSSPPPSYPCLPLSCGLRLIGVCRLGTGTLGGDHGQTQRGRPAVGCVSMFFDQTRMSPPPRLQVEQNLLR